VPDQRDLASFNHSLWPPGRLRSSPRKLGGHLAEPRVAPVPL
jgi:hypothetical protein